MARPTSCTCSEMQLHHVGCDCIADREAVIVDIFLDGYASDRKARMNIAGGLNVADEVRKAHGSFATVYHTRRVYPELVKVEKFDRDYIRQMSIGG